MSVETPLEFLDTNVVVYAHDTSAGEKRVQAIDLLRRVTADETARLSVQVLQEFFVAVTQKLPRSIPIADAVAIVTDLSGIPTQAPNAEDVLEAIDVHHRMHVSFWDAMVIRSAAQLRCSVLWSEDLSPGQSYDGVEVRNPFRS
jgi:predicted nucleic acid-binding protein